MPSEFVIAATALLMLLGLAGSVLPVLPGPPLIVLGAFIYAWHRDFTVITWTHLAILMALAACSQVLDYTATALGAKKFGASRWGMLGACAGGVLGLAGAGIIGVIIGSFAGAVLLELIQGRHVRQSMKIGLGTLLGFLGGTIGKLLIALIMIGIFISRALQ